MLEPHIYRRTGQIFQNKHIFNVALCKYCSEIYSVYHHDHKYNNVDIRSMYPDEYIDGYPDLHMDGYPDAFMDLYSDPCMDACMD